MARSRRNRGDGGFQPPLHLGASKEDWVEARRGSGAPDANEPTHVTAELLILFAWSFLAATILPLGSEPALATVVAGHGALAVPVIVATAGNYLGAVTTYLLAMAATKAVRSERALRRMERASLLIRRFGAPALLLSWVPLLGDAIVAAAGAAKMNFPAFSTWTIIGKAARYAALAVIVDRSIR
jgi:membrane protein YqaA with SNARE-associated domain